MKHAMVLLAALSLGAWRGWTQPVPDSRLSFLAVGQGDCVVLQHGGSTVLVDAAPANKTFDAGRRIARPELERLGVETLDLVLITHPDADHIGGLPSLAKAFPIGRVVASKAFEHHPEFLQALQEARIGAERMVWVSGPTTIRIAGLQATIDAPALADGVEDNQGSLFVHLTNGNATATLSGDASAQTETLQLAKSRAWGAQLVMAGHHGSATSSSQAWLEAVGPAIAVISCGRDNRYGHPHPEVLARLKARCKTVYQTALDGTLSFGFTRRGVQLLR